MATFSIKPNYSVPLKTPPRFLEARFGDGYAQTAPDGLNTTPQVWSLTFRRVSHALFASFKAFMDARWAAGSTSQSFDWLPPRPVGDGTTLLRFKCKDWSYTILEEEAIDIEATFEQVFE